MVNVPVLSKTISLIPLSASEKRLLLVRKPWLARADADDVIAVGVASDSAQGQVTTRTDSVTQNAMLGSITYQLPKTMDEITKTAMTK